MAALSHVDIGTERALVAAALGLWDVVQPLIADLAVAEDVFDPKSQLVLRAVRAIEARGDDVDVLTVATELEARGEAEALGRDGAEWLGERAAAMLRTDPAAVPGLVTGWVRLVTSLAERRRGELARADAVEREEAEIDAAALDDAEPASSSWHDSVRGASNTGKPPEPGTFEHDLAIALEDVRKALGSVPGVRREPLFVDAANLLATTFDTASWLISGLITIDGTAMIAGEPKTTKTWGALEIAVAVATGTRAFGEFYAKAGTAAYFFAEDQPKSVRNRVRALLAGAGRTLPIGRLHVQPRGEFIDVTTDETLAWIVASCRRLGKIDLLVLDPLSDIHSGEEDKRDSMAPVMKRLRVIGELLGCTLLLVHHKGKASESNSKRRAGQQTRGSGAIHGAVDSGLYLGDVTGERRNTFRNVVESEIKNAQSAGKFALELVVKDDDNGEAVEARWKLTRDIEAAASGASNSNAASAMDDAAFDFVRALAIRGEHLTRTGYKSHKERPANVPAGKMIGALDRLIDAGRLRLVDGLVKLPEINAEQRR